MSKMRKMSMTSYQQWVTGLVATVALLAGSAIALADGFIIIPNPPRPIPGHFSFAPLEVSYHRVAVSIDDRVAVTKVDQEFYNPNPQQLEGTYIFPLPVGAHIDKFSMDVNGRMMEAELLPADKARSLYEDIVRRSRDPALLEYVGRDAFRVRIFPIEGHGRKQIKLQYTELLKSDSGMSEYTYPLNTEKFSSRPLKDIAVSVNLTTKDPIKSLYSPSHNVDIRRGGERSATIGFEEHNSRPDMDFKLIFTTDKNPVGVDLMSYRSGPDDGYFLLMASPGLTTPASMVQPKDIAFVLDTSGSMAGPKMDQAKKALRFCLANLNEGDRFEIVRFSTEVEPLFKELTPATKQNVDKAQSYVGGLKPIGGTALNDALREALELGRGRREREVRPYLVIFLTDGQPTIGETQEDKIVGSVDRLNGQATRIFCFGIGTDINTHLLDRIASGTNAFSQYVLPEEDIEVKVSSFYTKIKEPVLANVKVEFLGADIRTTQLYPTALPDLYKGEVVTLFGRYSGHGPAAVRITGTLNGKVQQLTTDVRFVERDTSTAFIPRLWATRRIGWLLDEIRLHGENKELKDEVTRLAREHGIVTPYTAYLILEDERRRGVPLSMQNMREFGGDRDVAGRAKVAFESAALEAKDGRARSGGQAVANAQAVDELRQRANLSEMAQNKAMSRSPVASPSAAGSLGAGAGGVAGIAATQPAMAGYRASQNYAQQARVVNGRAFYQNGNTWTDSTAQAQQNLKQQKVKFNSDDYFALLKNHPDAAQWLSLGSEVDIVIGDTLYLIREES